MAYPTVIRDFLPAQGCEQPLLSQTASVLLAQCRDGALFHNVRGDSSFFNIVPISNKPVKIRIISLSNMSREKLLSQSDANA
jgi:hypothetical protein